MAFIRKIKRGQHTYLAKVENKWINGKVIQKHICYVGREINGKPIRSGTLENTDIVKVSIWAPLLVLNSLAEEVNLAEILGEYGKYLLSIAYAHCLEPKSVNKMEDWFARTDLQNILNIKEVSEEKLYNALDSIKEKDINVIQRKIFRSVTETYNLHSEGYFFDVTNVYFYGTECSIAKKGHNKEGSHHLQVQIGLAITKEEGIPIFHKTFEGNIFDARTLQDFIVEFHNLDVENVTLVWDRGVTSEDNIIDAKRAGFEVICGLAIKQKVQLKVEEMIKEKNELMQLKNRVRLKNTIFYCIKEKYSYGSIKGQLVLCFNEEKARINREKRIDNIHKAQEQLKKRKPIFEEMKKYFNKDNTINENKILDAQKYDGYSLLFSTKDLAVQEIVKPYFEKDKVEKAFRSLKSVLGLKPIKHWLEERVKSHIFICYISYLLLSLLEIKIKKIEISGVEALEKLSTSYRVHLKNKKTKVEFTKTVILNKIQEKIIKTVNKKLIVQT